ncbi:MAG: hypothetical protein DLM53_02755 [Candidatus Eremiobacter antarcticus]|nr:D-aminoacylase [Candidatus Eremiobacteraeota bacterium]MBC5808331.1 D-aminoacylase [Candidatus Eremiobacteraeota bacterium]PZR63699.1 MAG: hypothetical protein DLM53_02755 [Candidatus Eremiobacter sp. RRmetagenome_bin22]
MLDIVLENGRVIDGVRDRAYVADLGIVADKIVKIGNCAGAEAATRLDCGGLIVAPGFIDMHSHSDELLLINATADSKIRQGITTEVGGNCGSSPAPLSDDMFARKAQELRERYDYEISWRGFDGFFAALERAPAALNFCCLAGLGTVRSAVGGSQPRPLEPDRLALAQRLTREACEQGAIGVSSGLIYQPGSFADSDELSALARAAAEANSPLYASHIRSEGDALLEAVDEAIDVGRRADCAVQLSHHKAAGPANWGKVHDSLARVDRAIRSGHDVVLDQYPYKASSTGLDVILPEDVNVGSPEDIASRLADKRYAALVALRVDLKYGGRWHSVVVSSVGSAKNRHFEGLTMVDVGKAMGRRPVDAALQLLVEERLDVSAIYFTMCEEDVQTVLSYGRTCVGSDASARVLAGPTARGKPHPRAFGTFPRIFKRYVRDIRVLSLEEAVRRTSALPAQRLGLRGRGVIAESNFADVVVFDSERIADNATYEEPQRFPSGIEHVLVNGIGVVRNGEITGSRPGRVLRRGRDL